MSGNTTSYEEINVFGQGSSMYDFGPEGQQRLGLRYEAFFSVSVNIKYENTYINVVNFLFFFFKFR